MTDQLPVVRFSTSVSANG